jgi:tryptophanyl-tRNA synthetase
MIFAIPTALRNSSKKGALIARAFSAPSCSLEPGEAKDPTDCTLFSTYQAFASEQEVAAIRQQYADGIAWGEMKKH